MRIKDTKGCTAMKMKLFAVAVMMLSVMYFAGAQELLDISLPMPKMNG